VKHKLNFLSAHYPDIHGGRNFVY